MGILWLTKLDNIAINHSTIFLYYGTNLSFPGKRSHKSRFSIAHKHFTIFYITGFIFNGIILVALHRQDFRHVLNLTLTSLYPSCFIRESSTKLPNALLQIQLGMSDHYTHVTCHTHVTRMSHTCHMPVTHMSHTCHTHVTHMSHTCHTHVTRMSHACHTHVSRRSHTHVSCHIHDTPFEKCLPPKVEGYWRACLWQNTPTLPCTSPTSCSA